MDEYNLNRIENAYPIRPDIECETISVLADIAYQLTTLTLHMATIAAALQKLAHTDIDIVESMEKVDHPQPELKVGEKVRLEPKEDFGDYKITPYWNKYLNTKFRLVSDTIEGRPGIASIIDESDTIKRFPLCWLQKVGEDGE
jgi:hypothetical protein